MNQTEGSVMLQFPAATVVVTRPNRERLQDSAAAWLALAVTQASSVEYWSQQGDRAGETLKSIATLKSYLNHAERALRESELAK